MIVATVCVRTPSGAVRTLEADRVDVRDGRVFATGRWRGTKDRRTRSYSWSSSRVLELQYTRELVAA